MATLLERNQETGRRLTGGQVLMESLLANGVDTIFGYPGGAIMPTYDALYGYRDKLRHLLVRHEQGATHAAEGYARMKGRPGVVLVTSGPGATNTITGLADALMDSTPLVTISGQVARPVIGTQAFQEVDAIKIATPVTKWAHQVQNASDIPQIVDQAFKIAMSGRPGPVLIDIPKDVQIEPVDYDPITRNCELDHSPALPSETLQQLSQAADLLNHAKRPFILAGHGVLISEATEDLRKLAEKANIPVGNTLHGLSSFPTDHDLFMGLLGMHGKYGANILTNEADVILAIGMRFDDRVTGKVSEYAKQAKIIHIDIDSTQLNRLVRAEIAINADAKVALSVLLEKVSLNQHSDWLEHFRQLNEIEDREVTSKELAGNGFLPTMAEVINQLSDKTDGNAVIVADVGQHQMEAAQHSRFKLPRSFITSGGMGTMGFALPAGIGAKIAVPEREVAVVTGDGGFQMTMQELGTIMQEKLPVKIIILNNGFLGMVRQWQELFHEGRYSFVEMENPDFVAISAGYRVPAETVHDRQMLDGSLNRLLSAQGAYLLDIRVQQEDNVFPMIPSGAAVNEVRLK